MKKNLFVTLLIAIFSLETLACDTDPCNCPAPANTWANTACSQWMNYDPNDRNRNSTEIIPHPIYPLGACAQMVCGMDDMRGTRICIEFRAALTFEVGKWIKKRREEDKKKSRNEDIEDLLKDIPADDLALLRNKAANLAEENAKKSREEKELFADSLMELNNPRFDADYYSRTPKGRAPLTHSEVNEYGKPDETKKDLEKSAVQVDI